MEEEIHAKIAGRKVREAFDSAAHSVTASPEVLRMPLDQMTKVTISFKSVAENYRTGIAANRDETFEQLQRRDPKRYDFLVEKLREAMRLGHKL